jgi:HD-GYP domain-containing protein (c-di-GMP phosphodiesterase class II)
MDVRMTTATPPDQEKAYPSLITALCERDSYTRGHCDRVHALALTMGRAVGLHKADMEALRIASQLHDVGKIGVRDDVLLKPGRLTPDEWEEMKAHSVLGERIVRDTFLSNGAEVAALVRHHHESFDGSGYPDGLAGSDIPQGCRILLVIDAYDAMTTGRPYHKARTHGEAIAILEQESGTKLDPGMLAVFLNVIGRPSISSS